MSAATTKIATNPLFVDFFGAVRTIGGGAGRQNSLTGGIGGAPLGVPVCVGAGVLQCGAGGGGIEPGGADGGGPANRSVGAGGAARGAPGGGAGGAMPGGPLMRDSAVAPAVTFGSSVPQFLQVSPSPSSR